MAPKPLVPADFGIENLYDEFHGNVVLKLKDNVELKANSMILKMNSPVFGEIFRNLQIRTVDVDDFSNEAVTVFLESLYSGEVKPNKELFRDLTKMSNVFKVTWMVSKCETYFRDLVQSTKDWDYGGLKFVFEEATFLKNSAKKPGFLEIFLDKLSNMADKGKLFLKEYMKTSYLDLSKDQLNVMIQIAGEDVSILMNIMKNNVEEQGLNFDDNTKYLLQNIDLVNCIEQDMQLYEDLFELLVDMDNISKEDLKMLMKLNRDATKEFSTKEQSKLETRAALPTTSGTEVVPVRDIHTDANQEIEDYIINESSNKDSNDQSFDGPRNHVIKIWVPQFACDRIIGRGGSKILEIQGETGTRVDVNSREHNHNDKWLVTITGPKENCEDAEKIVNDIVNDEELESGQKRVSMVIWVETSSLGRIIGKHGSTIKAIERTNRVKIDVKKDEIDEDETKVVLTGTKDEVLASRDYIYEIYVWRSS